MIEEISENEYNHIFEQEFPSTISDVHKQTKKYVKDGRDDVVVTAIHQRS